MLSRLDSFVKLYSDYLVFLSWLSDDGRGWPNAADKPSHVCAGTNVTGVANVESAGGAQPAPPRSAQSRIFDIKDPR